VSECDTHSLRTESEALSTTRKKGKEEKGEERVGFSPIATGINKVELGELAGVQKLQTPHQRLRKHHLTSHNWGRIGGLAIDNYRFSVGS
jgi:hypothetical protein